jgi:hypothetical protein
VLTGIAVPVASGTSPAATTIWHLEAVRAELISRRFPAGVADNPKPARLGALCLLNVCRL